MPQPVLPPKFVSAYLLFVMVLVFMFLGSAIIVGQNGELRTLFAGTAVTLVGLSLLGLGAYCWFEAVRLTADEHRAPSGGRVHTLRLTALLALAFLIAAVWVDKGWQLTTALAVTDLALVGTFIYLALTRTE